MRAEYKIYDPVSGLSARIAPDYGGMITHITMQGKELLYLNETLLECAPINAGGIPILFPFSGKTKDDAYMLEGKKYYMPRHGLVKNKSFAVERYENNRIILWTENERAAKSRNYPYDFQLKLIYEVKGNILGMQMEITNFSEREMPHYLGWHPYFRISKRSNAYFKHHMNVHYDHVNIRDDKVQQEIDLVKDLDDVYCLPDKNEFIFGDKKEGYEVKCATDKAYQTLVVFNEKEGSICVEPWCGIPDSINLNRMVKYIQPGETVSYPLTMEINFTSFI